MASYLNGERRAHRANNDDDDKEEEEKNETDQSKKRNGIQKEWGGNERPETHN